MWNTLHATVWGTTEEIFKYENAILIRLVMVFIIYYLLEQNLDLVLPYEKLYDPTAL